MQDGRLDEVHKRNLAKMGDTAPRPELLGYSREAAQMLQVEAALAKMSRHQKVPNPATPVFPGERLQEQIDDAALDRVDAAIFAANPAALKYVHRN